MPELRPDENQRERIRPGGVRKTHNRFVTFGLFAIAAGMLGMAYAAVPLYRIFCQVTGYGGTTQRAAQAPDKPSEKMITVRFDANVSHDLDWRFVPVQRTVKIHIGEQKLVFYKAENNSDHPITGTATFNVTPAIAGKYFKKIQCFCFTEQTLDPHEKVDMSVSFFVDPGILTDPDSRGVKEITLSYTLFEKKNGRKTASDESKHNNGTL